MQVILYTNFSKRKNSTKNPDVISMTGTTKDLKLKDKCSRIKPSFFIADENRYTYLKAWGWYYFVTNIAYDINGAQYIDCELDVLGTWRTQIMGMSAFIRFSTSNYDVNVIDDRIAQEVTNTHLLTIEDSMFDTASQGSYIISTVNKYHGQSSYAVTKANLDLIQQRMLSDDSLWDSLSNIFNDVSSGILSLRHVPVDINQFISPTSGMNVCIGDWDTQELGYLTDGRLTDSVNITIPWIYNDFRRCSAFTKMFLGLPFIGVVELTPEKLIGNTILNVHMEANCITGSILYAISVDGDTIGTYSGQFGREIPVATSQMDTSGYLSGIATQVSAGIGGGITSASLMLGAGTPVGEMALVAGALTSAYSVNKGALQTTMAAEHSMYSHIGGMGGGFGEFIIGNFMLLSIAYNSRTNPSELTTLYGRPCYKVLNIGSLSGYVETMGFSIDTDAPDIVRSAINDAMDRGIYLE